MNPLVSVTIMCYNHEGYIKECIESALKQKTNFDFEIVIGDDASSDKTKEIISSFKDERIVFVHRDANVGLHNNITHLLSLCKGKYISLLEGDDYWVNPNKLQMQFEALEANKNCSVCFTDAYSFWENSNEKKAFYDGQREYPKQMFDLHYYLANTVSIPNNTKMFRRDSLPKEFPEIFFKVIQWDWILHLLNGLKGDFLFLKDITLAYRRHDNTIINEKNGKRIFEDGIYSVENINKILPKEYHKYFTFPRFETNSLAFIYLKEKRVLKFVSLYSDWLKNSSFKEIKWRDEFYKFRKNL